ncbi:LysR substrate-binding domain-containing protein [Pseudomonas sp. 148P]|uniref:LysR substrate-binding domain-containing protein n=1 Tax=Pseudomonas ulcerans TaxID=3115852 RepID=A0ABU7HNG6_9PSED|nr:MULTISPECIES: LysR substrate-binding domain-containing protein [unclassified Pseudomonas]MEE1926431.1 LysR substrate-binding domain-containing protein [Pseudomonas sp. 147P]MEE1933080.1 LysR substrate-binding domain-containing protein [Pseudomonas sp. 148P]
MADRLPPLYALRAFEVAARSCSFTRAGEELALTQSAISRHIRSLESHLGCRLFERHGPRLRLTDAGQRLARQLNAGFSLIEQACQPFRGAGRQLRLKAPSTLTMHWLLGCLERFRQAQERTVVQLSSVWMDQDSVDFASEPYDCAVLLGNGQFGERVKCQKLFEEWLIPICAPSLLGDGPWDQAWLGGMALVHPSADRRDWKRWVQGSGLAGDLDLNRGVCFDTLDQGMAAAMAGHGVSIGDLALIGPHLRDGRLGLPFREAVATGDGYYLVWPQGSAWEDAILGLGEFLLEQRPEVGLPC